MENYNNNLNKNFLNSIVQSEKISIKKKIILLEKIKSRINDENELLNQINSQLVNLEIEKVNQVNLNDSTLSADINLEDKVVSYVDYDDELLESDDIKEANIYRSQYQFTNRPNSEQISLLRQINQTQCNLNGRIKNIEKNLETEVSKNDDSFVQFDLNSINVFALALSKSKSVKQKNNKYQFNQFQITLIYQIYLFTLYLVCWSILIVNQNNENCISDDQCSEFKQCVFYDSVQNHLIQGKSDLTSQIIHQMKAKMGLHLSSQAEQQEQMPDNLRQILISGLCQAKNLDDAYQEACGKQIINGYDSSSTECLFSVVFGNQLGDKRISLMTQGQISMSYDAEMGHTQAFLLTMIPQIVIILVLIVQVVKMLINMRRSMMIWNFLTDRNAKTYFLFQLTGLIGSILVVNRFGRQFQLYQPEDSIPILHDIFSIILILQILVPLVALLMAIAFNQLLPSSWVQIKLLVHTWLVQPLDGVITHVVQFSSIFITFSIIRLIIYLVFESIVTNYMLRDVFQNAFGLLIILTIDEKILDFTVTQSQRKEVVDEINNRINDAQDKYTMNPLALDTNAYKVTNGLERRKNGFNLEENQNTVKISFKKYANSFRVVFLITLVWSLQIQHNSALVQDKTWNFLIFWCTEYWFQSGGIFLQIVLYGSDLLYNKILHICSENTGKERLERLGKQFLKESIRLIRVLILFFFCQYALKNLALKLQGRLNFDQIHPTKNQ